MIPQNLAILEVPQAQKSNGTGMTATGDQEGQDEQNLPVFKTLQLTDIANLPDAQWLISGILQTQSVSMLYGESNAGKSFLALDWSLRVSRGLDWLDWPTRAGAVLYIAAEGLQGMKTRIAAWMQHHGYQLTDFPNIYFIGNPTHLVDEKATLIRTIEQLPVKPALIVVDTLSMCTLGVNENSYEATKAIQTAHLLKELFSCHVMIIHHAGKGGDYRGFSGLKGNIDTQLELQGDDTDMMTLTCKKQRDGAAKFDPISLTRVVIDLGRVDDMGNAVTSCVVTAGSAVTTAKQLDKRLHEALEVLAIEGSISASNWQKLCHSRFRISESAFYHHVLPTLVDKRYVERLGERGKGARYQITATGEILHTANSLHDSMSSEDTFTASLHHPFRDAVTAVIPTATPTQDPLILTEQKTVVAPARDTRLHGPPLRACFHCKQENWVYDPHGSSEGKGIYTCGTCNPPAGDTA
jgi:hypothetical protein